jgi:hypothetical protein
MARKNLFYVTASDSVCEPKPLSLIQSNYTFQLLHFLADPEAKNLGADCCSQSNAENGGETWCTVSEDDLFWFAEAKSPIAYDLDARGFTLSRTVDGAIRATDNTDATVTLLHAMQEYRLVSQPPKIGRLEKYSNLLST